MSSKLQREQALGPTDECTLQTRVYRRSVTRLERAIWIGMKEAQGGPLDVYVWFQFIRNIVLVNLHRRNFWYINHWPNLVTVHCALVIRFLYFPHSHCNAGRRTDFWDQKSSDIFWRTFFWRGISGAVLLTVQLCSHQCLWSGFIFPELEHLYKNVFTASFPKRSVRNLGCSFVSKKRTRSGSNVSSRVGKDHPTRISSRFISRDYWMT